MIGDMLSAREEIRQISFAADVEAAERFLADRRPDVVTLDLEMPQTSGMTFLERLMRDCPLPVVMVSALTPRGGDASIAALECGAVDVVPKPTGLDAMDGFRHSLQEAVVSAAGAHADQALRTGGAVTTAAPDLGRVERPRLIGLAASTGGVGALSLLLPSLPPDAPPVLITQHMPGPFIERLVARLHLKFDRDIAVAREGERLRDGVIRFAPGHRDLIPVEGADGVSVRLEAGRTATSPCADRMFKAMSRLGGARMGAVLTGMGRDGALGALALRRSGGHVLAQDEATSVVFGMPRAAAELGGIDEVLPIEGIAAHLSTICKPLSRRVAL